MPSQSTKTLQLLIILLIPVFIILTAARFLATDPYLAFEYNKTSFPPDAFGFTQRQRFILASANIHYVRAHLPSDELAKQTLKGVPVYSPREVAHMADVQAVFQTVLRAWWAALILFLLMGLILWQKGKRQELARAIQLGGLLTLGVILAIVLLAAFAWQIWFDNFHLIFFEPGSWLFAYSDTLIRLFPLQFWIDATFTISILSLAAGILLGLGGWRWQRELGKRQV